MRARRSIIVLLLLAGCSPAPFTILATIKGKDLVFSSKGKGSWPFREKDNVRTVQEIEVREGDRVVWRIEQDSLIPGCAAPAPLRFPLTFNRTPHCYRVVVPSVGLQHGVVYTVESAGASSVDNGYGSFRISDSAENL
jgi:hypothetical protein